MTIQLKWIHPTRHQEYTNTFHSVAKAKERINYLKENGIHYRILRDDSGKIV